jgi:transketolase
VASEAASLAGHLGLDNLCWIYDNNHITIEGNTTLAFTETSRAIHGVWLECDAVGDANDIDRIEKALEIFRNTKGRPHSSSWTATSAMDHPTNRTAPQRHGEPLGDEEVRLTKRSYGWPENESFSSRWRLRSTSRPASARVAPVHEASGRNWSLRINRSTRSWRKKSS